MKKQFTYIAALILGLAAAAAQQATDADSAFMTGFADMTAGLSARTKAQKQLAPSAQSDASADETYLVYPKGGENSPSYEIVRKGEAYFIYGNGQATDGGGSVNWRDFQFGVKENVSGNFSIGIAHHNEGHPDNVGHRDGFAAMGWYDQPITGRISAEVGAGPYFSMNTVTVDGTQIDQKKFGLLSALAVVYRLTDSGLGVRAQYNYVKMPGSFDTRTIMIGLDQDLGGEHADGVSSGDGSTKDTIGVWGGSAITNRGGQQGHMGYQAEVQRTVNDTVGYSASVIDEGNSTLTNRVGAAAQVWYVAPAAGRFTVSAGAGPYVAEERDAPNQGTKLLGVISLRVEMAVTPKVSCGARMNRVVSSYNMDEDMFMAGCTRAINN